MVTINTLNTLFIMNFFCWLFFRLYVFRNLKSFRILIGGGDGTFGWVLSAVQDAHDMLVCKNPPSALLPLGTGE